MKVGFEPATLSSLHRGTGLEAEPPAGGSGEGLGLESCGTCVQRLRLEVSDCGDVGAPVRDGSVPCLEQVDLLVERADLQPRLNGHRRATRRTNPS